MRKSRKMMSVLIVLAMVAAMMIPMATPALANGTYTMSSVYTVASGQSTTVGNLIVTMDGATALSTVGKYVYFQMPSSPAGYTITPGAVTGTNAFAGAGTVTVTQKGGNAFLLQATAGSGFDASNDSIISVPLTIYVPGGVNGPISLIASAPSSSTFASGTITIANAGTSSVSILSESTPTVSSSGGLVGLIDVKESTAGSLANAGTSALKFKLPPGFSWTGYPTIVPLWGNLDVTQGNAGNNNFTITSDGRELDLNVNTPSTAGSFFKIQGNISVDESTAKTGIVTVNVSGATSTNASTLDIANYGDYSVSAKALDAPSIVSGIQGSVIGRFQVAEGIPGSLVPGRTVTLTLPSNVRWSEFPQIDLSASTSVGNLSANDWKTIGSDGRMIQLTINGANANNSDPAVLVFKNAEVTPDLDFNGDLDVTLGGSQGLTGTLTLANVAAGETMTASTTPDVKVGMPDQAIGDVTITENAGGSIDSTVTASAIDDGVSNITTKGMVDSATSTYGSPRLILKAPAGVTFSGTPTVEVTSGDIQLDTTGINTDTTSSNEGLLYIPIKSSSTTASTIKISGIKLTIDRTVPQGPLALKLQGNAVNETLDASGNDTVFPGSTTSSKVAVANVVTPAPGEQTVNAVFKIGDTSFTVNGVDQTMDVAPYTQNGRTFIPVRYAAQALGVSDSNIMYNNGKVTIIKGNTVVQLTIGSTTMLINGTAVPMDAAATITNGRTMLPLRWIGQALGATLNWDEATQTVTMNL